MSFNKKTIEDVQVKGKRVLVRCDFNVPLKDGVITDENRLVGALPTIKYLIENGAKVILCSHLGKDASKTLAPVAVRLSEMLGKEVVFARDEEVVGENARKAVADMKDGDVVLLENTRCRKEETKNVEEFSKELASLADIFVNDAFGTAHRAHCSTVGAGQFLEERACGYLIQKELKFLGEAVSNPVRPFTAILGGSKVSDKIAVINDISGFGRCSIAVSLPIISMLKVQCCPLPTSIFSNHTGFPSFFFEDFTKNMEPYMEEWKKLDLKFNGISTGFLGSAEQIRIVQEFISEFKSKDTLVIVDPVMGDYGKTYSTYTEEMCQRMKQLACKADILTPNLTEACILTDTP